MRASLHMLFLCRMDSPAFKLIAHAICDLQYHSHKPIAKLFFFFLILLPPLVLSSSSISDSLSQGSSLSVEKPADALISTNGVFSAGFHAVGINAYCFAVWFTASPLHHHNGTLVWAANRDQPVNGRFSKLSLLANANLILTDARHSILWATNTVSTPSVTLRLYDTGNLVLRTSEGVVLWQSFDSPTDTLLPTQPLTRYTTLVASRTQTDLSRGFYKLFFDDDNVLRLVFDGPQTSSFYWPPPWLLSNEAGRSRYNDSRIAVFDFAGQFTSSDRLEFRAMDFGVGPQRRLTLDFDGNLRLYSLQQEEHGQAWAVSWQAMTTPCRIHGACGPNSLCSYDPYSGRTCSCLPSFRLKNHTDWSYGCVPEMEPLCNPREEATFLKLPYVDFYGYNIHILRNYTLDRCTEFCLGLCDCKGFQYRFNETEGSYDCYPKRVLRNGHRSPNFGGALYLKVPKELKSSGTDPAEEFNMDCKAIATKQLDRSYNKTDENSILTFLIWFAGGAGLVEIICIALVLAYLYRTSKVSRAAMDGYSLAVTGFRKFSYSELKEMTRSFGEEIGRGGGGVVYKGLLPDHRVAAIKCLNDANQGEEEFLAEVRTIGRLNHMNLIDIWGYCAEGKHRLLVYEFMEHGSLADNLISNTLDWEKRFDIAVGTAKGLAYLHEECLEWVLHCDVKPQNILLGANYHPKVSDFGLSKLLNRGGDHNSSFSRIRGTRGYMAPEWIFNLPITSKVDVYSYGIVVLEMVTGKRAPSSVNGIGNAGEMEQRMLVKWVRGRMSRGDDAMKIKSWIEEIVDPMIKGEYEIGKMETLVRIALQCVEEDRDARPTMSQVLEMLLPPIK